MIKTTRLTRHLNTKLKRFSLKVVTPVVLLAGLLALAFFNFQGVLATTTQQDDLYKGEIAYSTGPLQYTFQQLAGTDRPSLSYDGLSFLTYVDWSSTISIDGHVQNLWDNYHGYDYDRKNPDDKQFFSTTSAATWQVIEVVSLLNAHTITVHYDFVAHAQQGAYPHSVTLNIEHVHHTLYEPAIRGNTLVADVLPGFLQNTNSGSTPHSVGTLTFQVSGPALAQSNPIALDAVRGNAGPDGVLRSLTDSFTTTYTLQNPEVNRMMPLGTETIVFTPSVSAGTPIAAPVATPTAIGI
ncbi:MAG TPA: hypothetical protein VF116_01525 [Ktedonobacterales bacterium]